jgi:excisionase family DNA binding protein
MAKNDSEDERTVSPVMTVKDICSYLRIHHTTLYRMLKAEKIPHFRVGADYRFSREAIDEWMKNQKY